MSIRVRVAFLAILVTTLPGPAAALPILDQEYDPTIDRLLGIGQVEGQADPDIDLAQTFTVGITGILTSVEVLIRRESGITEDLLFDIRTIAGGVPTEADAGANVLANTSLSAAGIPLASEFVSVDLSSFGLAVTAGEVLSIVLQSDGANPAYLWSGTAADGYAGGGTFRRFLSIPATWGTTGAASDLAFRTFVEPVPEPSTALLLMAGILGLGTLPRRASRQGGGA